MKIDTTDITTTVAEIVASEAENQAKASQIAAAVAAVIEECAATIRRMGVSPIIRAEEGEDGYEEERATWVGIKFAGGRQTRHTGQGGTTRCWSIYGRSYYVTDRGAVVEVAWDGDDTDFSSPGYEAHFTGEVDVKELAGHLEYAPESAQEIIDALRKAVAGDLKASKDRGAKINAIIATLK